MKKILFRIDEVMSRLSVSRRTVYRLLEKGELTRHNDSPGRKGLRVTAASIDRYYLKNLHKPAESVPMRATNYCNKGKTEVR